MSKFTEEQVKKAFDAFDTDHSGTISTTELYLVFNQCGVKVSPSRCEALVKQWDGNNSGVLELDEFKTLLGKLSQQTKH